MCLWLYLLKYKKLHMDKCLPIYFALSNSKLVKENGEVLTQAELLKLWEFLNLLIGSRYSTFIMRGESNENLKAQYNFDTEMPELLAQCIFMAGEKGRICWNAKKYLDPDNTSLENFESICKALKKDIRDGCKGKSNRTYLMQDFYSRNKVFCDAFELSDDLIHIYEQLSINDRKRINLYYLSIAHTINSHKYKEASSFISTTTNSDVADQFTSDATIYGWVPRSQMRKRLKSIEYVITENSSYVKRLGLPYCDTPVYPEQKEIALRCGILPHFIIGFKVDRNFYVNPSIFRTMAKMEDIDTFRKLCAFKRNFICNGLEVDQNNFNEFCRKTNFKRYYTYDGNKYEIHYLY